MALRGCPGGQKTGSRPTALRQPTTAALRPVAQARHKHHGVWYSADTTFARDKHANDELGQTHRDIEAGRWPPTKHRATSAVPTLRPYGESWLDERDLAPSTHDHYAQLLRDHIYPRFGDLPVSEITAAGVRTWHADLASVTGPTARAHAYALLRSIMNTAVGDELLLANPCRVRAGGRAKTTKKMRPAP
jgi:hypothetical protein